MFGYVMINKPELKIKDYAEYRGYYCGLCKTLKQRYGRRGQMTLSYDMTFLTILLTGVYEPECIYSNERCILHPTSKHPMVYNRYSEYAADMNILLSYYNFKDDWADDKSCKSLMAIKLLKASAARARVRYPRQARAIITYVKALKKVEDENVSDLDRAAGLTGTMLGEIFAYANDEWASTLRQMGFYLGKYIYLMDAYEDLEEDIKKGSYNPWITLASTPTFEGDSRQILTMMVAECARAFERLPVIKNVDILRNILYSGIWEKYQYIQKNKSEKTGDKR